MAATRQLIVNADDFGLSFGVNRGIIKAYAQGIVTSASLLVRWPAAVEAAAYGREHPNLSLGLHVDLGEWNYRNGAWVSLYKVVPEDTTAVTDEVARQLAIFRSLVGKNPTHIDSHQHVHLREPARCALLRVADHLAVPLRHYNSEIQYCGDFYGQTAEGLSLPHLISVDGLTTIIAALPPGLTELCCHPGEGNRLDTMYRSEREQEVKSLCHAHVREVIADMGIKLCSFNDVAAYSMDEKA